MVMAPWHMEHPPLSVWGSKLGSAARFHRMELRLQLRMGPTMSRLVDAAMSMREVPGRSVVICSVKKMSLSGRASCT